MEFILGCLHYEPKEPKKSEIKRKKWKVSLFLCGYPTQRAHFGGFFPSRIIPSNFFTLFKREMVAIQTSVLCGC